MLGLALLSLGLMAEAELIANDLGQPQELKGSAKTARDVCEGRSSVCSVLLDVPTSCAGSTSLCPVVLIFHGHGGNVTKMMNSFDTHVHDNSFIGVYPQGELYEGRAGWNDGSMDGNQCAYNDYNCTKDPNDGLFVAGIISVVKELGSRGRIYGIGGSNGANEVQILASNACDALPFVAIGVNSGQLLASPARSAGLPYNYNQPCAGSQPCSGGRAVAQLSIHGDADLLVPFQGGPKNLGPSPSKIFKVMDEPGSNEIWARQNKCTGPLSQTELPATGHLTHRQCPESACNTTATHFVYGGCPATAPVEYYQTADAGHGGTIMLGQKGPNSVIFEFFMRVERAHKEAVIVV